MNRRDLLKTLSIGMASTTLAFLGLPLRTSVPVLYGDGVHDDTDALQTLINGKSVMYSDGKPASLGELRAGKTFLISNTLTLTATSNIGLQSADSTVVGTPSADPMIRLYLDR